METEVITSAETPHVLAIALPFQGHMSPMVQLCSRLASKGLKVTFILICSDQTPAIKSPNPSINLHFISRPHILDDRYFQYIVNTLLETFPEIVAQHGKSGNPVSCLVYDALLPGVLDIAKSLGLAAAPFFTMSCSVSKIFYTAYEGKIDVPVEKTPVLIESLPPLDLFDLPSSFFDFVNYPNTLQILKNQFLNTSQADWVFFNTFTALENQVLKSMERQCKVTPVGPTIPSQFIDGRIDNNNEYGLSLYKPEVERCKKWLDSKEIRSVVYVSFGSIILPMSDKQIEEIASGIKNSNYNFLWVVRESEAEKLPKNFTEETSEKGLLVSWCHQLEVLSHSSVGCFVSHCGWNSTMEALSLGVPMVAMPQAFDQITNAKCIADVWENGVRVEKDVEGIVTKEEIEMCTREIMEGDKGKEISKNSDKWKMLAKEAIDEGGSSDKNIQEFVEKLRNM